MTASDEALRLQRLFSSVVRSHFQLENLHELSPAMREEARSVNGLYKVLDRGPTPANPHNDLLAHLVQAVREYTSTGARSLFYTCLSYALLMETADTYDGIGYDDEAAELRAALNSDGVQHKKVVGLFVTTLNGTRPGDADPVATAAVGRALSYLVTLLPEGHDRSGPLVLALYLLNDTGNFSFMGRLCDQLDELATSNGYLALAAYYRGSIHLAEGEYKAAEKMKKEAVRAAARVGRADPAHRPARHLVQHESWRLAGPSGRSSLSLPHRAGLAISDGDWPLAIELYDQFAEDGETSPETRAVARMSAEALRFRADRFQEAADVDASLARLARDDFFRARTHPEISVIGLIQRLLETAVSVSGSEDSARQAMVIADLAGEYHGGAAVGALLDGATPKAVSAYDVTLIDLISTLPGRPEDVGAAVEAADADFLWPRARGSREEFELLNIMKRAGEHRPEIRRAPCSAEDFELLTGALGKKSEGLGTEEVGRLSRLLFAGLEGRDPSRPLYVVAEPFTWNFPWSRLVPEGTRRFAVIPSAVSLERLPPRREIHRVIMLHDESLKGSAAERTVLRRAHDEGRIELTEVTSAQELGKRLRPGSHDLLSIAVHGSKAAGSEQRLLIPTGHSTPAGLFSLPLPPVVVLASCWSARYPAERDSIAMAAACLSSGASVVLGGLWDIDDTVTGGLLSRFYESVLVGAEVGEAYRNAFLAAPERDRGRAGGVTLIGRV